MKVLIVGAGPAGSTAAYHLATAGIDVTVLEKTRFPREKVCGDGLTPRAVREMQLMGLPHDPAEGWRRNKGLRLIAGGRQIEVPWPELSNFPDYGLIRTRLGFDEALAAHARAAGAVILEGHSVSTALTDDAGTVVGARASLLDDSGRKTGESVDFFADVVLAADGNSTRTAVSLQGVRKAGLSPGVARLDCHNARRVGVHGRKPGGPHPRCRASHGVQPDTALLRRPDVVGRRRGHGQPVQR